MNYRLLGKSGLRVSEISLGTMTFGEDWGWGSAKDEARKIYDAYLEAGGNFVDTANLYTNGTSETFLGEFMHDHRALHRPGHEVHECRSRTDANAAGNHRKSMVHAVEASLRRLKTDYIDLYWLHNWDRLTPAEEVMRAFDDLIRQGKVLYIGISDAPAWWVAKANTLAELRGWTEFIGLQIEYSLARAHRRKGTDSHGQSLQYRPGRVVPAGGWPAQRKVPGRRGQRRQVLAGGRQGVP